MQATAPANADLDRAEEAIELAKRLRKWARWSRNVVMQKTIVAAADYLERAAADLEKQKK